jgi:hypothetical protein
VHDLAAQADRETAALPDAGLRKEPGMLSRTFQNGRTGPKERSLRPPADLRQTHRQASFARSFLPAAFGSATELAMAERQGAAIRIKGQRGNRMKRLGTLAAIASVLAWLPQAAAAQDNSSAAPASAAAPAPVTAAPIAVVFLGKGRERDE